jgi:hypothetical protein
VCGSPRSADKQPGSRDGERGDGHLTTGAKARQRGRGSDSTAHQDTNSRCDGRAELAKHVVVGGLRSSVLIVVERDMSARWQLAEKRFKEAPHEHPLPVRRTGPGHGQGNVSAHEGLCRKPRVMENAARVRVSGIHVVPEHRHLARAQIGAEQGGLTRTRRGVQPGDRLPAARVERAEQALPRNGASAIGAEHLGGKTEHRRVATLIGAHGLGSLRRTGALQGSGQHLLVHLGHEAIADPRQGLDDGSIIGTRSEGLAQRADPDAEITVLYGRIRPELLHELVPGHDALPTANQRDQQVKNLGRHADGALAPKKRPAGGVHSKGMEDVDDVGVRHGTSRTMSRRALRTGQPGFPPLVSCRHRATDYS